MRVIDKLGEPLQPELEVVSRKLGRQRLPQWDYRLQEIAVKSRIIIVEGISGSGKDTLQRYLKNFLSDRDIHDYSEGEVLQSWNQLQIKGISRLQIKFMKLFLNYVKAVLDRDKKAVFLMNRFHLSAYVLTIIREPKLKREYNEVIGFMKSLPVHVLILQLDPNEIEARTLHPERSGAWEKFQEQIVRRDGFKGRVDRYLWQQRAMLTAAEIHQLPYSVIKISTMPGAGLTWIYSSNIQDAMLPSVPSVELKTTRKKGSIAPVL